MISKREWVFLWKNAPYILMVPVRDWNYGTRLAKPLKEHGLSRHFPDMPYFIQDWVDWEEDLEEIGTRQTFYVADADDLIKVLTTTGPVSVREWLDANYGV